MKGQAIMEKDKSVKIVEMSFYLIFREIWEKVKDELLSLSDDKPISFPEFLWNQDKGISSRDELQNLIGRNTCYKLSVEQFAKVQEDITGFTVNEKDFVNDDGNMDWKKYGDTLIDIIFEYVYGIVNYTEDSLMPSALYSIVNYKSCNIDVTKIRNDMKMCP